MRIRGPFALACAVALLAGPASAQSLFATRGLGVPVTAVDARARALGGIGVGIAGLTTSLANPADMAGLLRTGVTAALQPTTTKVLLGGEEGSMEGARFPLLRVFFPVGRSMVFAAGYGAVYEQSFGVVNERIETVGNLRIPVTDEASAEGGLSELGVGLAWTIHPRLSVGLGGGLYAGSQRRRVSRTFPDTLSDLDEFRDEFRWNYKAPFVRAGVRWDPLPIVRLGAAVTVAGELDVNGEIDGSSDERATLPTRVTFGGSGFLAPTLMLAVGGERLFQGSERAFEDDPAAAFARDTWRVGGGLEWGGVGSATRTWPLRVGASWAQLPYYYANESPAEEWSVSGGIGFRLAGDPSNPLAVIDATAERGVRTGLDGTVNPGGLEERFWRFTLSLSLFGN